MVTHYIRRCGGIGCFEQTASCTPLLLPPPPPTLVQVALSTYVTDCQLQCRPPTTFSHLHLTTNSTQAQLGPQLVAVFPMLYDVVHRCYRQAAYTDDIHRKHHCIVSLSPRCVFLICQRFTANLLVIKVQIFSVEHIGLHTNRSVFTVRNTLGMFWVCCISWGVSASECWFVLYWFYTFWSVF